MSASHKFETWFIQTGAAVDFRLIAFRECPPRGGMQQQRPEPIPGVRDDSHRRPADYRRVRCDPNPPMAAPTADYKGMLRSAAADSTRKAAENGPSPARVVLRIDGWGEPNEHFKNGVPLCNRYEIRIELDAGPNRTGPCGSRIVASEGTAGRVGAAAIRLFRQRYKKCHLAPGVRADENGKFNPVVRVRSGGVWAAKLLPVEGLARATMNQSPQVQAIVAEVLQGNRNAFRRLVEIYALPLRSYLASQIYRADDVDDLAQEVFIAAYRTLPKYSPEEDFAGWLWGIAPERGGHVLPAPRAARQRWTDSEKRWPAPCKRTSIRSRPTTAPN